MSEREDESTSYPLNPPDRKASIDGAVTRATGRINDAGKIEIKLTLELTPALAAEMWADIHWQTPDLMDTRPELGEWLGEIAAHCGNNGLLHSLLNHDERATRGYQVRDSAEHFTVQIRNELEVG